MRFDFTEEQYALRDGAREFFAGECTPADVRAAWEHETGVDASRWKQMAETGFIGLTTPEEHGGLGLSAVDLVLLLEEAGAAALPEPLLETAGIVAPVLAAHADGEVQQAWLPALAAGEVVATVALERTHDGRWFAPAGHVASLVLVVDGDAVHAVGADRVRAQAQPSVDRGRRVATLTVETAPTTQVGGADAAADARDRAAAGAAAVLGGVSRRLVAMTVDYVVERVQFGRPVGSFQAVKHQLAEAHLDVETARPAAWYAAYAIAAGLDDRTRAASVAKSAASDAASTANHAALQCHGGIGFTWEHDLHLWLKRAGALERSYGTAAAHRARLAGELLD